MLIPPYKIKRRLPWSITDFQPKFGSKSTLNDTTEQMKLFLAHPMVFCGSIWKIKSGLFLFVMPLGLSVATEIVLTMLGSITDFQPKFGSKSTLNDTTKQMKLFLTHTIVFVGSIWKIKSGCFLFVMPMGLSVAATEIVLTAGVHH
jgi:penicillin-binding protein-related factor A (putative recombinase)